MTIQFQRTVPVFRIFARDKAKEFHLDFLGFKVDREASFEPGDPVYMQISRGEPTFHLSEHFGDATPASTACVYTTGVAELHHDLNAKKCRPGLPGRNGA